MKLKDLIGSLPCRVSGMEGAGPEITGVVCDSREVRGGELFVAIKAGASGAEGFIKDAIGRGAAAVATENELQDVATTQVVVPDARAALASLSSRFFGDPSKGLKMVGITGTNGKTTVSYLIESVLGQAGIQAGVIGTVSYRYRGASRPAPLTTPEAPALQALLRDMQKGGVTHCVMEVSSHAIAQKRIAACGFDVRVFTNLSPEHLDYHGTMEEYGRTKSLFFSSADFGPEGAASVINIDDELGGILAKKAAPPVFSYSMKKDADIYPEHYSMTHDGIRARLSTPAGPVEVSSPLVGEHNMYNIMAAAGAALALGLDAGAVEKGVNALAGVPGRLERVDAGTAGPVAYVDYAHTPDALEKTLLVLGALRGDSDCGGRHGSKGRIITVFGCGGNRDRGKRPLMAGVVMRLSDVAVVTSDNPRDEEPIDIINDIEKGMQGAVKIGAGEAPSRTAGGYLVIADREEAIRKAVEIARQGDTLLIAGKGHEGYQIIKGVRHAFDDRAVLRQCLADAFGGFENEAYN